VFHFSHSLTWDTTTVTGSQSYKQTLENVVSIDLKGFGAAFSGSLDFKTVTEKTSSQNRVFTKSDSHCSVYCGTVTGAALDADIHQAIGLLPSVYDADAYYRFVLLHGTHVAYDITMGTCHIGRGGAFPIL
jgi:hypothetical protein